MIRLVKPAKKANSSNLYPPTKAYFRETCDSQNINPISPALKHTHTRYSAIANDNAIDERRSKIDRIKFCDFHVYPTRVHS